MPWEHLKTDSLHEVIGSWLEEPRVATNAQYVTVAAIRKGVVL